MAKVSQLRLLLWKNWKLLSRKRIATTLEIVAPVFFALLLFVIRFRVKSHFVAEATQVINLLSVLIYLKGNFGSLCYCLLVINVILQLECSYLQGCC